MRLLLTAKITPDCNNYLLLVHAVQELHSSMYVRRSFWCLIMASTKLNQYMYARSLFCKHIFKRNVSDYYCHFLCLNLQDSKFFKFASIFYQFQLVSVDKVCTYKKVYNLRGSYSATRFFYKQLQLLRIKVSKWPKAT